MRWLVAVAGLSALVGCEDMTREERQRMGAALSSLSHQSRSAPLPMPDPTPMRTNCRPNFVGGYNCTTFR